MYLLINQVGKLNVYRNADPAELAELHPSDRLMVQLIKIDRLGPRIEGMLYKVTFEDTWTLLDEVSLFFCPFLLHLIDSRVQGNCLKLVVTCWMLNTLRNCYL